MISIGGQLDHPAIARKGRPPSSPTPPKSLKSWTPSAVAKQQAARDLLPLVYDELRRLAARRLARESPGQTLQATALVHEAYLRLVGPETGQALGRPRPLLRRRRRGDAADPGRERPAQASTQARRRPSPRARSTSTSLPPRSPTTPRRPARPRRGAGQAGGRRRPEPPSWSSSATSPA